jgi:hypothetical protein
MRPTSSSRSSWPRLSKSREHHTAARAIHRGVRGTSDAGYYPARAITSTTASRRPAARSPSGRCGTQCAAARRAYEPPQVARDPEPGPEPYGPELVALRHPGSRGSANAYVPALTGRRDAGSVARRAGPGVAAREVTHAAARVRRARVAHGLADEPRVTARAIVARLALVVRGRAVDAGLGDRSIAYCGLDSVDACVNRQRGVERGRLRRVAARAQGDP